MKKAVFLFCLIILSFSSKLTIAHGFGAHAAHLQKIIELNLPGSYLDIITDSRYKPYFIYGSMFPDLQYTANYKSTLQDLYQKVEDIDGVLGLTYEIPLDAIPSTDSAPYPFGINTHHDKYAMAFAEYLFIQSGLPDPPGPDPGYESQTDSKNRKIAFALGYYAHLAEDVAAHNFLIPKLTATLNLGDIELIKNSQNFEEDPNAQQEGIIEGIIDHYYGDNNLVEQTIYWDVWVHYNQKEPTLAQMNPINWTYDDEMYDPVRHNNMINPVLVFFHEVLNDWYNNNPFELPASGFDSYKETYAPISLNGLYQLSTVFRFVNRFYPAIAGHPYNGYDRLDQVLADYIGNHLDIAAGWDPLLILGDFLQIVSELFDFRRHLFEQIAYPSALATTNEGLAGDARSLTSLMLADMDEADRLVNSEPDLVNIIKYNKLKSSILFTNPHSILDSFWDEYITLGSRIYAEIGPPNKWYTDWSPWHKQSMAWGVLSSLNNSLPDIYTSNQNVAIYDAYFEVNNVRITGPQQPQIFENNPTVKTKVELYNTSNVPSESITLKVKKDDNSTDYSLDPLKTSTTFSIDHDPLLYNTTDRKKVELTVPSVSLTDLVNYRGYYMEVIKNSNNKAMFSSSFEQYQERLDLTPNYVRLYGSYDEGKWPVSLGLVRSVATVNLNAAQFPEGVGSGGTYEINGIAQNSIIGFVDDYINLEALPPSGWIFLKWSDSNTDNPRTYRITSTSTNLSAVYKGHLYTNSSTISSNNQRKIVRGSDGSWAMIYVSMNEVWLSRSTDGVNWEGEIKISSGENPAGNPHIAVSGIYVNVLWQEIQWQGGNGFDFAGIYLRSYNLSDNSLGQIILVDSFVPDNENFQAIPVMDGEWSPSYTDEMFLWKEPDGLKIKKYSNSYGWSSKGTVTGTNSYSSNPSIVSYNSSVYYLCWADNYNYKIKYIEANYGTDWNFFSGFDVSPTNWENNVRPQMTLVGGNKPTIVWTSRNNIVEGGASVHIRQRIDSIWQNITSFSQTTTESLSPVIGDYYGSSRMEVLWNIGNTVYKASFNGTNWSGPSTLTTSGGTGININRNASYQTKALWKKQDNTIAFYNVGSLTPPLEKADFDSEKEEILLPFRLNRHCIVDLSKEIDSTVKGSVCFEIAGISSIIKDSESKINYSTDQTNLLSSEPFKVAVPGMQLRFAGAIYGSGLELNDKFITSVEEPLAQVVIKNSKTDQVLNSIWLNNAEMLTRVENNTFGEFREITLDLNKYLGLTIYVDVQMLGKENNAEHLIVDDYLILTDSTSIAKSIAIKNSDYNLPADYILMQNYPNPFNPVNSIVFFIPQSQYVTLEIYNALGQEVMTVINETMEQGYHSVKINMTDEPSGVYLYSLSAGSFRQTKKLLLIK